MCLIPQPRQIPEEYVFVKSDGSKSPRGGDSVVNYDRFKKWQDKMKN